MENKKILVIDNDEKFLKTVKYTLEQENYEVITSLDARQAINILKKDSEIFLLLVDLQMGTFSGIDFLKEIENFKRPLKRIVFTGHQKLLSDKKAKELNLFAYLEKGAGLNSLLFTIKSAFNELELEEARQWRDMASITTEVVHLIGNKISPIRRRIEEISTILNEWHSKGKIDHNKFNRVMTDVDIIKEGAEQAHSIKSDLIDGSIHKESINITNLVVEVIAKNATEYGDLKIEYPAYKKSHFILANEKIIRRIFDYVIKNAVQAIEDKNNYQASKGAHVSGLISITAYMDNEHFCVDIKDNGCGIEEQDLDNIFKPFFTTKGADRGSGVGLYFCKRMMQDLDGNIIIKETIANIGTTISLKFPHSPRATLH